MTDNDRVWHLPGLGEPGAAGRRTGRAPSGAPFAVPRLDGEGARRVAATVREAGLAARRERSVDEVIEAAARAAGRLADPDTEAGRRAVEQLAAELGWGGELVRETLAGMADAWRADALRRIVREELGDPAALDGWVDAPPAGPDGRARRRRASGPPLLLVVHAGNVPGVAVTAAIRGLVARSGVLSKAPAAEPGLLALFARELAREDPLLGRSLAVTWWYGDEPAAEARAWSEAAGGVVVYGGEGAVRGWRERLPGATDLRVYGPKVGIGVVLPDAVPADTASQGRDGRAGRGAAPLARDVCAYEQAGCVSPRVVYVVGEDPVPWARELAAALEEETGRIEPPPPGPDEAVALRSARAEAEFAGYDSRDGRPVVLTDPAGTDWTVIVGGDPAPATGGLPRVVRVHGVASVEALGGLLAPLEGRIQAMGHAGEEGTDELADLAHRLGVARVAPFGRVAWPPADWRHDGRHQILPLICWTDHEE